MYIYSQYTAKSVQYIFKTKKKTGLLPSFRQAFELSTGWGLGASSLWSWRHFQAHAFGDDNVLVVARRTTTQEDQPLIQPIFQ